MGRARAMHWAAGLAGAALLSLAPRPASAGYFWGANVLSSTPSVCFVGFSVLTRPDRVLQILNYMQDFQRAANIRFNVLGACPLSTGTPGGNDFFDGDIRINIPGSGLPFDDPGMVPGIGCTLPVNGSPPSPGSSWARPPDQLAADRPCLYNLKLGDDADAMGVPWRNHTLHEVGHALGLAHEHERPDAMDTSCTPKGGTCPMPANPGPSDVICMTPYDTASVMHYEYPACMIAGNYSHSGLSAFDKLALHILYPETNQVAELVGTKVVRSTGPLGLQSAWQARGANVSLVARNFRWQIGGSLLGTSPSLSTTLLPGEYPLTYTHEDFLGRSYSYTTTVRSLTPDQFTRTIAAVPTSTSVLVLPTCGLLGVEALLPIALALALRRRRRASSRG